MIKYQQRQQLTKLLNYSGDKGIPVRKSIVSLLDEVGIYPFRGKYLLTEQEKKLLKKYIYDFHGEDLDKSVSYEQQNRFDLAKQIPDEKRGGFSVFGSLLNFSGNTNLPFKDGSSAIITPNYVVSCKLEDIELSKITSLIVVENGTNIIRSRELIEILPEKLKSSLILFKGYKDNAAQVNNLLESLSNDCGIYYFFDYDPSGLFMMINLGLRKKSYLLVPERLSPEVISLNKHSYFSRQNSHMQSIYARRNELSFGLRQRIEEMQQKEYAITQENIVAHGLKLEVLALLDE